MAPSRLFWYVSIAKLNALGASAQNWHERLRAKLSFKLGPASAEVGIDSVSGSASASVLRLVGRIEEHLRREGHLVQLDRVFDAGAPSYFTWEGHSARAAVGSETGHEAEAFWVASVSNEIGVLLVGSVAHAVGAGASATVSFSPSYDPVGAVRRYFEPAHKEDPETARMLDGWAAAGWERVMSSSVGTLESMPRTQGVAQYAGSFELEAPSTIPGLDVGEMRVRRLVIGSPLWVEQVGQKATRSS